MGCQFCVFLQQGVTECDWYQMRKKIECNLTEAARRELRRFLGPLQRDSVRTRGSPLIGMPVGVTSPGGAVPSAMQDEVCQLEERSGVVPCFHQSRFVMSVGATVRVRNVKGTRGRVPSCPMFDAVLVCYFDPWRCSVVTGESWWGPLSVRRGSGSSCKLTDEEEGLTPRTTIRAVRFEL